MTAKPNPCCNLAATEQARQRLRVAVEGPLAVLIRAAQGEAREGWEGAVTGMDL